MPQTALEVAYSADFTLPEDEDVLRLHAFVDSSVFRYSSIAASAVRSSRFRT